MQRTPTTCAHTRARAQLQLYVQRTLASALEHIERTQALTGRCELRRFCTVTRAVTLTVTRESRRDSRRDSLRDSCLAP